MINKYRGYTISEVLITLSVVGVIALLTIPGIMKDVTNKSRIALLQNTISNLNNAIQNELVRTRKHDLNSTDIVQNPKEFFENSFDTVSIGEDDDDIPFSDIYYPMKGNITGSEMLDLSLINSDNSNVALLKNGVAIAIYKEMDTGGDLTVAIDVNGKQAPNIVGVDYFEVRLATTSSEETGVAAGDIVSYDYDGTLTSKKALCSTMEEPGEGTAGRKPDPKACYHLLETSGFDHNYANNY